MVRCRAHYNKRTMSLGFDDFQTIRMIMREELDERIGPLERKVAASENDVKEIREEMPNIVRKVIGEEVPVIVLQIIHAEVPPIVRDEVKRQVGPLEGCLIAVENDVKEIYYMISDLQQQPPVAPAAN